MLNLGKTVFSVDRSEAPQAKKKSLTLCRLLLTVYLIGIVTNSSGLLKAEACFRRPKFTGFCEAFLEGK